MFLGLGAKLLLAALAAGTVAAIVVYVAGTITRAKIREKALENGIKKLLVKKVDNCSNKVTLSEITNDGTTAKEMEIHGDDIDDLIDEGDIIYT